MQGSRFIHRPGRGPSHGAAGDGPRTSERDPNGRDGRAIEGGVGDEGVRKTIEAGRAARGRRAVLGSLALGAGLAAVASTGGCETMPVVAPVFASAAVRLCVALVESVVGGPVDDLPAGYGLPHREKWIVEGQSVEFCLYASPTPGLPVFVQLGCEGPFHEVRARRVRRPDDDGDGDTDRDMVPAATISGSETIPVGDGLSIEKLDCRERLLLAATIAILEAGTRAESTFLATGARTLPRAIDFPGVSVAVDGVATDPACDRVVRHGDAVGLSGPLDAVAAYAHACGVRELAFESDGSHWRLVAHDEHPIGALFRDGVFEGARVLSAYHG
ncbi:MAG: hypothetical protein RIS86_1177 [Planctomycetota bacterium]